MVDKVCLDCDEVGADICSDVRVLVKLGCSLDAEERCVAAYDLETYDAVCGT